MMELDQTNEFLVTPRQDPFFNPNAAQAVAQVKQNAAPHGPLTRIGYSAFSGGMMANSDSLHRIEATCTDKGTFLRVEEKEPFKKRKEAKYLAPIDVWQTLCAFAEREQLAALCELKGADPMQGVMDYSSSAHIELEFNDKPLGGSPYVSKSVELYVLDQHGLKEVSDTLLELLDGAVRKGKKTRKQPKETPFVLAESERWICPGCGHANDGTAFCAECGAPGSKKKEDG